MPSDIPGRGVAKPTGVCVCVCVCVSVRARVRACTCHKFSTPSAHLQSYSLGLPYDKVHLRQDILKFFPALDFRGDGCRMNISSTKNFRSMT